jgi:hypothetical protein
MRRSLSHETLLQQGIHLKWEEVLVMRVRLSKESTWNGKKTLSWEPASSKYPLEMEISLSHGSLPQQRIHLKWEEVLVMRPFLTRNPPEMGRSFSHGSLPQLRINLKWEEFLVMGDCLKKEFTLNRKKSYSWEPASQVSTWNGRKSWEPVLTKNQLRWQVVLVMTHGSLSQQRIHLKMGK